MQYFSIISLLKIIFEIFGCPYSNTQVKSIAVLYFCICISVFLLAFFICIFVFVFVFTFLFLYFHCFFSHLWLSTQLTRLEVLLYCSRNFSALNWIKLNSIFQTQVNISLNDMRTKNQKIINQTQVQDINPYTSSLEIHPSKLLLIFCCCKIHLFAKFTWLHSQCFCLLPRLCWHLPSDRCFQSGGEI